MQIVKFGQQLNNSIVVCLGFFDCMHKGHIHLVNQAKRLALQTGSKVALFTFSNNHLKVLGKDVKQLFTFDERCDIYANSGIDVLLCAEFSEQFKSTSCKDFLQTLAIYNLKGIVCGFDYTCGSDRLGADYVKWYFRNIPVEVVDAICEGDTKISTTYIRRLLSDNQLQHANALLDRNFSFKGDVVHGRGIGKSLGFATANVVVDADKYLPSGVFCGQTTLFGTRYKCLLNIGAKPTYDIADSTVEVHLLGYDDNLYGKQLTVELTKYLRPIYKFQSETQLIEQLCKDKENCLND